jgi:1-acyl-sn-glycerol-3-phosphate acyltransferase
MYNHREKMVITISPEGTRRSADHWKTGFYYIARGAQIPVAMGFLDYSSKTLGIGGYFYPSGDMAADLSILRRFYADKYGKNPSQQGEVRFLPRNTKL